MPNDPVLDDDLFLTTQFTVPPPPRGMVERPRLTGLLHAGCEGAVTLLCAPAGSGKTALLSSALGDDAPAPVAWLSLEPGDDVPERFWTAVLTALRNTGALPPESALATLAPRRGKLDDVPPLLVNALAELPERIVLVLDDVHFVRSRECLAQLAFLLLHAPPSLAVVLSARADPSLPLHVPRVQGTLTEIRARDLAFTTDEADALLNAHGIDLAAPLVAALCKRTEGWAAGLRLAVLGLRDNDEPERYVAEFAGDAGVVGDYLIAEVLDRQPARVRTFLLRTSILDRLSGELTEAVTADGRGADTLALLERTNGFVLPLDGRGQWFRYHRLFATLLRARARRELAGELAEAHRRAARWYARQGMCTQALRHAIAGDDAELGLDVIATHWFELFVRGRSEDIRSVLDTLPQERLHRDPALAAIAACAELEAGDPAAGTALLKQAAIGAGDDSEDAELRGTIATAELCAARVAGDLEGALAEARNLLTDADDRRGALVHAYLGETALWSHRFDHAAEELSRAVELARAAGLEQLEAATLSHLALRHALADETAGAQRRAHEAIALATRLAWGDGRHTACAHLALAFAAVTEMRPAEAAQHLERASASGQDGIRGFDFLVAYLQAELHGMRGRPAEGLRVLERFELTTARGVPAPYERSALACLRARLQSIAGDLHAAVGAVDAVAGEPWLIVRVLRARLLLCAGEPDGAVEVLESAQTPAMLGRTRVERAVLRAVALDRSKEPQRAGQALEEALALAEPSGHRWAFLTIRGRVEPLLRDRIRHGTARRAFVDELLAALADPDLPRRTRRPLLEPLTERERALLRYLPTSLTNREIAAELFITANTVKTHLRSIYRKLDVEQRAAAVTRARELHLLTTSSR